ncbi:MAG: hypothetical protein VYA55_11480 [Pseudomonadota bacterium]|nr:hypothetical protein [Pseudomonadota bacterium]
MKAKLTFIPAATQVAQTIQDDECLIFTHIPKAAGTTLDRLLKGVGSVGKLPWRRAFGTVYYQFLGKGKGESRDDFLSWDQGQLDSVRIITGHVPYGIHAQLPRQGRYVTLLRDPISRTLSHFKMGVGRRGWPADEPLAEVFRKGGLVSDVQVRMLAGVLSPHEPVDESTLETALANLEEHYLLVGFSDTFNLFTSAVLGFLDAPNALLGEEQSGKVSMSAKLEDQLKLDAEQYNQFDIRLYEAARPLAEGKLLALLGEAEPALDDSRNTLLASSQVKINKNEYSIIPADQRLLVMNKLQGKGIDIQGL